MKIARRDWVGMAGSALAGLGGGLLSPVVAVSPGVGQSYVGQAFMTVVTGGPAFLLGTLASSTILGGVGNLVSQLFTNLWGLSALQIRCCLLGLLQLSQRLLRRSGLKHLSAP